MNYYNPNERKRHRAIEHNKLIRATPEYSELEWLSLKYVLKWCARCGSEKNLTKDHKTPIGRGGSNSLENLTVLCDECNKSKGSRTTPNPVPTYLLPSQEKRLNELSPELRDRIRRALFGPSASYR